MFLAILSAATRKRQLFVYIHISPRNSKIREKRQPATEQLTMYKIDSPSRLTSLREELRVDDLEVLLAHDPRGTLRLEAPIDALHLGLGEPGRPAQRPQRVRPVARRLLLLVLRI